ncbi:MAG TPA: glycosyltransferase [Bryobacteraceae bacterium]|nr:glycosyltransferase [Bryobacteraceae bacterium]
MAEIRRRDTQKREQPVETVAIPQEPVEEIIELRVSVVLVAHNQAPALRRAIEALEKSQNRERMEIIVVDCASSDDSPQLDIEFEGITLLRLPHHFGATKAMNIGARTAKAELVFYLSPNVEVAPDTVTQLADRLEAASDTSAVSPLLVDPQGKIVSREQKIREAVTGKDPGQVLSATGESVAVEYMGSDALMVRKQFIKGMNYFDERFGHFGADADLAMKIRNAQRRIRVYPGIHATIHATPDPLEGDPLFAADHASGVAAWLGKYDGFFSGLSYRIGAILRALAGFRFKELTALVSGQKLDGSQSM